MRGPKLLPFLLALVLTGPAALAQKLEFNDHHEFMDAFAEAVKEGSFTTQRKLVEKNIDLVPPGFRSWETTWCELSLSEDAGQQALAPKYKQTLDQLAVIYRVAARRNTLSERNAWLDGLNDEQKQAKVELWKHLAAGVPLYDEAKKQRTAGKAEEALDVFWKMTEAAERAGDAWWITNGYFYLAELYEITEGWFARTYCFAKAAAASRRAPFVRRATEPFQLDDKLRKSGDEHGIKVGLIDTSLGLEEARKKYEEALEKQMAAGGGDGGGEAGGEPGAPAPAVLKDAPPKPTNWTGDRGWVEGERFRHGRERRGPGFWTTSGSGNGNWVNWEYLQIKDEEQKTFNWLPGRPKLKRDGTKLFVVREIRGREREERIKVKATGKPTLIRFKGVEWRNGVKGEIYHWIWGKPNDYKLMGDTLRKPSGEIELRVKGATTVSGTLRGVPFAIHDAGGNGSFNDFGSDTVIIGKGRNAVIKPLSRYMEIEGGMYEVEVDASGTKVKSRPYTGPLALLDVDYEANIMPFFLIAQGPASDQTYFVNLMEAVDEPIWVVPTELAVSHGYIGRGEGVDAQTIIIERGRSEPFHVRVGQPNKWVLGGAGETGFHFLFDTDVRQDRGDYIIIPGDKVQILGNAGEAYKMITFEQVQPTVEVRREDGKVWFRKEMRKPGRSDWEKNIDLIFHPRTMEIRKMAPGDYEVRLEADYPPLGKITSKWSQ